MRAAVETALPHVGVRYLVWRAADGTGSFVARAGAVLLLAASGIITAVPLLWFTEGARRLKLSTLGLMQYVAPTAVLLAVFTFGEPFTRTHALTFACIWRRWRCTAPSGVRLRGWRDVKVICHSATNWRQARSRVRGVRRRG